MRQEVEGSSRGQEQDWCQGNGRTQWCLCPRESGSARKGAKDGIAGEALPVVPHCLGKEGVCCQVEMLRILHVGLQPPGPGTPGKNEEHPFLKDS